VDWTAYELFAPGVHAPLRRIPRAEAIAAYKHLMAGKPHRLESLRGLLATDGVELASDDVSIQRINDWFRARVEEDPEHRGYLLPKWYSVVNDLGLFLGDVMIERNPQLRWEFYRGAPSDIDYQNPVIMGFSSVKKFDIPIGVDGLLAMYGQRLVVGHEDPPDEFLRWINGSRHRIEEADELSERPSTRDGAAKG
jgi:hypothetical protein